VKKSRPARVAGERGPNLIETETITKSGIIPSGERAEGTGPAGRGRGRDEGRPPEPITGVILRGRVRQISISRVLCTRIVKEVVAHGEREFACGRISPFSIIICRETALSPPER